MSATERPPLVLIAEDDADDQLMLRQAFRHAGFEGEIEFCGDGDELLRRLDSPELRLPSLLLLDLKMPCVGGLEALAVLRDDERLSSLPVVAITSSDMPKDVQTAYQLGVNAYLRKPIGLEPLRSMVRALKHFWLDQVILPDASLA